MFPLSDVAPSPFILFDHVTVTIVTDVTKVISFPHRDTAMMP